jgi:hypothetical protein
VFLARGLGGHRGRAAFIRPAALSTCAISVVAGAWLREYANQAPPATATSARPPRAYFNNEPARPAERSDFCASSLEKSGRTCSSVRSSFSTSWRRNAASTNKPHARCGNRSVQEAVHHSRSDLAGDLRLFLGRAHHDEHEVRPGLAQAFRESRQIPFYEHAVEQRHRHAPAVQVRNQLRLGRDENQLVGWIDYAAEQPDERPILRNCSDRHRRRSVGEHGRIEFRLRQHDDVDGAPDGMKDRRLGQFTKICQFIGEGRTTASRSINP